MPSAPSCPITLDDSLWLQSSPPARSRRGPWAAHVRPTPGIPAEPKRSAAQPGAGETAGGQRRQGRPALTQMVTRFPRAGSQSSGGRRGTGCSAETETGTRAAAGAGGTRTLRNTMEPASATGDRDAQPPPPGTQSSHPASQPRLSSLRNTSQTVSVLCTKMIVTIV